MPQTIRVAPKTLSKKRQMIVAVAKDVLKLMRAMSVRTGNSYLVRTKTADSFFGREDVTYDCGGDPAKLQKAIPKIAKECTACAKGAMVLAHIHLYDGVTQLPTNDYTDIMAQKLFGRKFVLKMKQFRLEHFQ